MNEAKKGIGSIVGSQVRAGPGFEVGNYSIVGEDGPVEIGSNVRIGNYCLVEAGVALGDDVQVDSYCRIGENTSVGDRTQVLYGAQLTERVTVGARCVVGGSIIDDSVLGSDVTYMGVMAHSYREPGTIETWDLLVQRSIRIGDRTVIGEKALLIGGITVGARCYIAAGEVIRCDVPSDTVVLRGAFVPIQKFRGLIQPRQQEN